MAGDNIDHFAIAQQVQGLAAAYMAQRNRVNELETELNTRREDIRRLEKLLAAATKK